MSKHYNNAAQADSPPPNTEQGNARHELLKEWIERQEARHTLELKRLKNEVAKIKHAENVKRAKSGLPPIE